MILQSQNVAYAQQRLEVWGPKICVYSILSVPVLVSGDNLEVPFLHISHFGFYFHLCFKSQFSHTF